MLLEPGLVPGFPLLGVTNESRTRLIGDALQFPELAAQDHSCQCQHAAPHVRYGSLADIGEACQGCPLYPQEADRLIVGINVC